MGTAASVSQAVRDRNAQQKLNYRLMLEQALGGSIRSNKDYINNMIGGLGSDLITAGAYLDGGGIGEEEQVLGGDLSVSQPETVYYSQKAYGEHKVVKWDEDRAEFLLDLDGQKFWSNPFRIQNCG